MYAAQILSWTTLELDAREVHELGTADLEKIQDERARAAAILGHPDAATAEAAIAHDSAFRFESPKEPKATAEEQVRRNLDLAPAWFGRVPRANCEVPPPQAFPGAPPARNKDRGITGSAPPAETWEFPTPALRRVGESNLAPRHKWVRYSSQWRQTLTDTPIQAFLGAFLPSKYSAIRALRLVRI